MLARHWPDLLLALLATGSPLSARTPRGGVLTAFALLWVATAVAVALAAMVRRETSSGDPGPRDARLLALGLCGVQAVPGFAAAAFGADPFLSGVSSAFRFGAAALVVLAAAARLPGRWPAPALAAAATLLEAGRLAGAGVWAPAEAAVAATGSVLLLLLAVAATAAFERGHDERLALRQAVEEHERVRREAAGLRAQGDDGREPEVRSLTPEGRRASTMDAVAELDRGLDRLLALAALALRARSVALFLLADDGERLALRRAHAGKGTALDRGAEHRAGAGILGEVVSTRRPALCTDLDPGALRPPLYADGTPVPSLVAVPVSQAGVLRGVLLADDAAPGAFAQRHERLLAGFAAEVGVLFESASAAAGRLRRGDRFETFAVISRKLAATLKVEAMLEAMLELTAEIVPADRCALFTLEREPRRLVLRAQRGFFPPGEAAEAAIPLSGRMIPVFIATHGRALLFTDLKASHRGVEIVPGARGQERVRSLLGLPLSHPEGLVGVWVLAADRPGSFDAEHLGVLSAVAAQAATLIANAQLHQTVERLAVTDGLTGLYNHRRFQEKLQEEIERGDRHREPVSLLLLDIDHFKRINDAHGHPFGDTVLKALSAALGRLARRVDFVARYGGEEFAVILVNTDRRGCRATAQRVLKAVRALRVPRAGGDFSFTVSIGTATSPEDARSREELVACADRALYAAKAGGRDRAVAFPEVDEGAGRR